MWSVGFFSIINVASVPALDTSILAVWTLAISAAVAASWIFYTSCGRLIELFAARITVVRVVSVVLLYSASEVIRTVAVHELAREWGLEVQSTWFFYVVAGASNGLLVFGLVAIAINDTEAYRSSYQQLLRRFVELETQIESARAQWNATRTNLITQVRQQIDSAVTSVFSRNVDKSATVVDRLFDVVNHVVRPLSRDLYSTPVTLGVPTVSVSAPRTGFGNLLRNAFISTPFRPRELSVAFLFISAPAAFFPETSWTRIFSVLLGAAIMAGGSMVSQSFTSHLPRTTPLFVRISLVLVLYVLMGTSIALAVTIGLGMSYPLLTLVLMGGFGVTFLGLITAVTEGMRYSRDQILHEITELNETLEVQRVLWGSYAWAEQKRLARILHSDVQATLIASAMKLRRDLEDEKSSRQVIQALSDLVEEAVATAFEEHNVMDIDGLIDRLRQRWEGIVEFTIDCEQSVRARVTDDQVTVSALEDILFDSVTNAVKHSHVNHVRIELSLPHTDRLVIQVSHSGNLGEELRLQSGLGFQILDTLALRWDITQEQSNLIVLRVELPLQDARSLGSGSNRYQRT